MTIRQWLLANQGKYGSLSEMYRACARELGVRYDAVTSAMSRLRKSNGQRRRRRSNGMSRDQFRSQYDIDTVVRNAIRKGLESLSDDEILTDAQFRLERCGGVGTSGWKQVVEEDEFLEYQFRCDGKTWWATKATVRWALAHVSKAKPV